MLEQSEKYTDKSATVKRKIPAINAVVRPCCTAFHLQQMILKTMPNCPSISVHCSATKQQVHTLGNVPTVRISDLTSAVRLYLTVRPLYNPYSTFFSWKTCNKLSPRFLCPSLTNLISLFLKMMLSLSHV